MAKVLRITTGIMGDTCGDLDPRRFAAHFEDALRAAYPDAEINITLALNLVGSVPAPLQTAVDVDDDEFGSAAEREEERVDEIGERVFARMCGGELA